MEEPTANIDRPARVRQIEKGFLLNVGTEVYPVYGSDQRGWTLDSGDLQAPPFRYQSLAELFFVIVNLSVATNGRA